MVLVQVRSSSLQSVGITQELCYTLGLQATGALAHLASLPNGCPALLALPGVLGTAVRLLTSKIPDAVCMASMLLGVVSGGAAYQGMLLKGAASAMAEHGGSPHSLSQSMRGLGLKAGAAGMAGSGGGEVLLGMAKSEGLMEALTGVCAEVGSKQVSWMGPSGQCRY